jgi:hypothetical protein
MKANKMHYFSNLFDNVLHVSNRSTAHHQQYLNTVYTAVGICHAVQLAFIVRRLHSMNPKQVNTLNTEQAIMDCYKLLRTVVSYYLLKLIKY